MKSLVAKLRNDPRIKNSLWMLIEKSISLFGLIFIVSAVAKYTGPIIYGEISLAASIFIVLKTVAQLGLDQIFFKYVSASKPYYNIFLINSIKIASLLYFLISLVVIFISYFFSSYTGLFFIVATAIGYYFNTIDLVNYYNEAKLLSKINVFSNLVGLVLALFLRYIIVFFSLNILYLCLPIILMTVIPFLIKYYYYYKEHSFKSSSYKHNNLKKYSKYIFFNGIPLTLSILTIALNTQVANYFLAYFDGTKSVAIYSVAFVLAGAWCIVPTTLIMSYMTTIYNTNDLKSYITSASNLLKIVFVISIVILIFLYILGGYIIDFLYGKDYVESILVFKVLIFMQFFWVVNFYFSRLVVKYNGYKFLAYKSTICCFLNIIIMYFLVLKYSVLGAALALLISEFISMISNLVYKKANIPMIIGKSMVSKREST